MRADEDPGGNPRCPQCMFGLLHPLPNHTACMEAPNGISKEAWGHGNLYDRFHVCFFPFALPDCHRFSMMLKLSNACLASILGLVYKVKLFENTDTLWNAERVVILK